MLPDSIPDTRLQNFLFCKPQTEAIRQVSTDVSFIFIWFTTTKNISALIVRKKEDSEGLGVGGTISTNPVVIIPPLT